MTTLIDRVETNIISLALLKPGQRLLVAVSGGVDSIVLLTLLHLLASKHAWRLTVAHFNHRLRGRSSDADERFVQRVGERLKLAVVSDGAEVSAFAAQKRLSLEMAARHLRHEFLARTASRLRISTVALAHHADDQVELFFLRLFRGSGSEGLTGMRWASASPANPRITLVRPLLNVSKADLEEFARVVKISFREDRTNARVEFDRNRVRHKLMPVLRHHFLPHGLGSVLRSIEIMRAEAECVEVLALDWLEGKSVGPLESLPVAVQRRVLLRQLFRQGLVPDFELVESLRIKVETPVTVADGWRAWRDAGGRIHLDREPRAPRFETGEQRLSIPGRQRQAHIDGCKISWRTHQTPHLWANRPPREPNREFFDAEKVGPVIVLRHWQPGDRFQPIGLVRSVKLQDWFVNLKVPRSRRHQLLLATTEQGTVFWVEGMRIGDCCRVTPTTRHLLEWRWSRD